MYIFLQATLMNLNDIVLPLEQTSGLPLHYMPRSSWSLLCMFDCVPYTSWTGGIVSFGSSVKKVVIALISFRFPKRNFRCDCATEAIAHPCSLNPKVELENTSNQYSQNFKASFCRCGRPYDAKTEKETMIQCLSCEVSSQSLMTTMHAPKSKKLIGLVSWIML